MYKLCYISKISETISDWTPETKAYLETEEAKRNKEIYGWADPNLTSIDYPNPEYKRGEEEYIAFFTQDDNQTGDDWDNIPYECNSSEPYDSGGLLKIKFAYPPFPSDLYEIYRPEDYPFTNTPWSCNDINLGAIPWLFMKTAKNTGTSIMAGIGPEEFKEKIKDLWLKVFDVLEFESWKTNGLWEVRGKQFFTVENTKEGRIYFFEQATGKPIGVGDKYFISKGEIIEDGLFLGGSNLPVTTLYLKWITKNYLEVI